LNPDANPPVGRIFTDNQADFRANYPRNMIPIALDQGISTGYLRPADGIIQNGTGPGINRGGILWEGEIYRVMGTDFVSVAQDGTVTTIGTIPGTNRVSR
jgi:hypothetical protein